MFCSLLTFSLIYVNNISVESNATSPSNYNLTSSNTFVKLSSWLANKHLQLLLITSYLNDEFLPGKFLSSVRMWRACSDLRVASGGSTVLWLGLGSVQNYWDFHIILVFNVRRKYSQSHSPKYSPLHGMPLPNFQRQNLQGIKK